MSVLEIIATTWGSLIALVVLISFVRYFRAS